MELNAIQQLMQSFNDMGFNRLHYTNGTESLLLEKGAGPAAMPVGNTPPAPAFQEAPVPQPIQAMHRAEEAPAAKVAVDVENTVKAPMVGVFYPAPSPDAPAYVQMGQSVVKGQTLCILEAMKVLNEIQAEWDGVVEAILVNPEDIVEYGQPLFQIRRA